MPTTNAKRSTARNKEIAATLRDLARVAEKLEDGPVWGYEDAPEDETPFTCTAINRALGKEIRRQYEQVFDLGLETSKLNRTEYDLWGRPDCGALRVLMLSFAAAMAERGDL